MSIKVFSHVVLWATIAASIVVWIVFRDSLGIITKEVVLYYLGVLITGLTVRFGGEYFLRRFLPSALDVQSNVVRCLAQSIGVGMFIVVALAGSIHLHSPELWKYTEWLLPMTFLLNTGAVFLALLLRARLAAKRNL